MSHREPSTVECTGCGIRLSDGYAEGCNTCNNRRQRRLRRGEVLSPTGYAAEAIDNLDPRGRLVSHV